MKFLVATTRTQGERDGDYMACIPGELTWLPWICDIDRRDPDRGCGCSRGFGGLASHRATTTVEVAELTMTESELRLAFETSLRDQGWIPAYAPESLVSETLEDTLGLVRDVARSLPVGTVVRRDFEHLHAYPMSA